MKKSDLKVTQNCYCSKMAVFDVNNERNPYISYEQEGEVPSKGTYICQYGENFYSVAPKSNEKKYLIIRTN